MGGVKPTTVGTSKATDVLGDSRVMRKVHTYFYLFNQNRSTNFSCYSLWYILLCNIKVSIIHNTLWHTTGRYGNEYSSVTPIWQLPPRWPGEPLCLSCEAINPATHHARFRISIGTVTENCTTERNPICLTYSNSCARIWMNNLEERKRRGSY